MKLFLAVFLFLIYTWPAWAESDAGQIENQSVEWQWRLAGGKFKSFRFGDKLDGKCLFLSGNCFQVVLSDGSLIKSSDFKLDGVPKVEQLKCEHD